MTVAVTLVTCPDRKTAAKVASALVDERLAACVNIVPGITSVYRWEGRIHRDRETLLIIKSRRTLSAALTKRVKELHPYSVPEVIQLNVVSGSGAYLAWVRKSTMKR